MTTTAIKPARPKRRKTTVRQKSKARVKQVGDVRRETKTQSDFRRWMAANAGKIGKWASANTKRLTGREVL
jgi:hypothetical protein